MDAAAAQPEVIHAVFCGVVAGVGACFSCLDRQVKIRKFLWYISFASFLGWTFPFGAKAFYSAFPWWGCLPFCFALGFCCYGIAKLMRNSDNTVGNLDITSVIKKRLGLKGDKEHGSE